MNPQEEKMLERIANQYKQHWTHKEPTTEHQLDPEKLAKVLVEMEENIRKAAKTYGGLKEEPEDPYLTALDDMRARVCQEDTGLLKSEVCSMIDDLRKKHNPNL